MTYEKDPRQTFGDSREFNEGIHWIQSCRDTSFEFTTPEIEDQNQINNHSVHSSRSAYLINGEKSLLFDTLSPMGTHTVINELEKCLQGEPLDYLVVSHPDIPHAGNVGPILGKYPNATLVAPRYGEGHDLYHLGDAIHVGEGDTIDLGDYQVEFHEAAFLDAAVSVWMTEQTTDTLFTVDWLGLRHLDGDCLSFLDELNYREKTIYEFIYEFHASVMFWYEYVDERKTSKMIDYLIDQFDPSVIAPAHGMVIREDATKYMDLVKDVIQQLQDQNEPVQYTTGDSE